MYPLVANPKAPAHALAYSQHSLGQEASENGVLDARIYPDGVVAFLGNYAFVHAAHWPEEDITQELATEDSIDDTQDRISTVTRLADVSLTQPPTAWALLPPEVSPSRQVEVLLAAQDTILLLDNLDCQDEHFTRGPFVHVVPSPNGRFLALVNAATRLFVVSSDFNKTLSELDLTDTNDGQLQQVAWCGNNSILLAWPDSLLMVGPGGDTLSYELGGHVHVATETDSARVLSKEKCELVSRVADSTAAIFRPGSASPAAILYEATEAFDRKSPKADESMRNIRPDLVAAVDTSIDAAGHELDVYWQRKLLKAAAFGKTFLDLYNPSDFVHMTQSLRVLNAVRHHEIGLPITMEQFRSQAPSYLINRLTHRYRHLLAAKMAAYLGLPQGRVLKHWAEAQLVGSRSAADDSALCKQIIDRLAGQSSISPAEIARTAWDQGQTAIATRLLEFEPKATKQVALLLSMKEDTAALTKALASSDPDLVYSVLQRMIKAQGAANFFRSIDTRPDAIALFRVWAKVNAVEMLRDFNYQDDRRTDSACLLLDESLETKACLPYERDLRETDLEQDETQKINKVKEAARFLTDDKERGLESKMIDEQLRLLSYQQALEKEGDGRKHFVGLSLNETLRQCLIASWPKKADKVRSEFKVPDKRFWWIKLKALTEARDWEALDAFAKSKRSPIGYEPFVTHLLDRGEMRTALSYVPRCEGRNRAELYVRCGDWQQAAEDCKDRNDRNKLVELRQRAPNNILAAQMDAILEGMTTAF